MSISRKAIWIFSIAAIVAIGTLTLNSCVVSAGVIHVPGDYTTIQQAINAVDAENRTIEVNATAYNAQGIPETIDVNKSNIIIRSVNGRAVIDANGTDDHVVNINDQTNVTLDGFTIRDARGGFVAGIYMNNASECTISNNNVTNITGNNAYGIFLLASRYNTFSSSTLVSSVRANRVAIGIFLYEARDNRFSSSTSVSNITSTEWHAFGIYLGGSSNNTFNSSTRVSSVRANQIASGITLYDTCDNRFSSSTSVSNVTSTSENAYGIDLGESSSNTFSSSTAISHLTATNDTYGIYMIKSTNNNFTGTSIANLSCTNAFGVFLNQSGNNSFNDTTVSSLNATYGVHGIHLSFSSNNNRFNSNTSVSNITGDYAYGLWLEDSSDNRFNSSTSVSHITAATQDAYGIWLYPFSNNNTFNSNTSVSYISAVNVAYGISLVGASTNIFSSNISVSHLNGSSYACGICLWGSSDNRFSSITSISTITAINYDAYGIYLFYSSNDNSFTDFTITEITSGSGTTSYGVSLFMSSGNVFSGGNIYSTGDPPILYAVWLENCTHNTITESEIWNNGHGFWLNQSDNNTIERNMIVNNKVPFLPVSGAFLTTDSDSNGVNGNCFYFNGWDHQAWDDGIGNNWTGNFWDDWYGSGPYPIEGSANNSDNNPLDECLEGAAPAFWDPGDEYKMHYPQLPDPEGWDVFNSRSYMLADDWQCTESGPVTDIHIWGSWKHDLAAIDVQVFHLEIWDNDNSSGLYSKPGERLWQGDFNTRDYTVRWNGTGRQGFYSPQFGFYNYLSNNHNLTYQYNFYIEPSYAFNQTEGNIYWLVVASNLTESVPFAAFGLKTSNSTQFGDNAVFWNNSIADWSELIDPITNESLDLAFVITGEPQLQPQPSPVPALTPSGLLALVGLLSAIAAVTLTRRKRR